MRATDDRKWILVVDDEKLVRDVLKCYLTTAGYAVELAPSGPAALDCLETATFDGVVTDNNMPCMMGAELAVILKKLWPTMVVVMFTGCPPAHPVPCLDEILYKPGDYPLLVPTLQKLLGRPPA